MKQLKDRKFLITTLSLAIICTFTLTIAYSALSAVLTIQGNARVSAADWDIYLNNPRVTNGSATTNVPVIKTSSTLEFETTLNMPGDFYEFVVDVVNAGDIDAMIENVVKTPELTTEQAKFLKYEVSYQNGESITTKQLLAKDTTMPIKVRIEYRKDLNNTDLPTSQVVLDLALTLEYIQSDGTGSTVTNNGTFPVSSNGELDANGTIVTIGTEQFYTIGTEGDNIKLLSMMNITLNEKPIQSSGAGKTVFSSDTQRGVNYSDYSGSIVETYVNNYKNNLESNYKIEIADARLITNSELSKLGCSTYSCSNKWIYSTIYWTSSAYDSEKIWRVGYWIVGSSEMSDNYYYIYSEKFGVRPVIVISKDYFN